ncbi:MAG: exodeoxyribonuclease VII small subunit [Halothiobacillaceae bacterium]|nr:MAG: exodeoxyribonuclease VII small subunit [Halothiobacillaceae bacterium]
MATRPRKTAEPEPDQAQPDLAAFEASLKELEAVVQRMEQGEQSLEASLRDFERGVQLTRTCQGMLASAQQRVDILSARTGQIEPFVTDDDAR